MKFIPEHHELYPRDVKLKWAREGRFALAFAKKGYPKAELTEFLTHFRTKADAILYYYCALGQRTVQTVEHTTYGPNHTRNFSWQNSLCMITDIQSGDYEERTDQYHLDLAIDGRDFMRVGIYKDTNNLWTSRCFGLAYMTYPQDFFFVRRVIQTSIKEATMYWSKRKLLQGLVSSRVCVLRRARRHRLFDRNVFIHVLSVYLQHPKLNVP